MVRRHQWPLQCSSVQIRWDEMRSVMWTILKPTRTCSSQTFVVIISFFSSCKTVDLRDFLQLLWLLLMLWFHVQFTACNNCRLSNMILKQKLHAINCTWNHGISRARKHNANIKKNILGLVVSKITEDPCVTHVHVTLKSMRKCQRWIKWCADLCDIHVALVDHRWCSVEPPMAVYIILIAIHPRHR